MLIKVFVTPPKSAFPLMELNRARVVFLDDWRFNDDIVPYALQLLWFEGQSFTIARPQNQHAGHTRYEGDSPVFITTLESDITTLKRGLQSGDIEMMTKRLRIFQFHRKLVKPDRSISPCGVCFAKLVLGKSNPPLDHKNKFDPTNSVLQPETDQVPSSLPQAPPSMSSSSSSSSLKPKAERNVAEVCEFLRGIELGHVVPAFMNNGVDGAFLLSLSEQDLVSELGLTVLQARKIKLRF